MTDKILPQIEDWQNRPLDEVYPILYIDAIHYSVRDNGIIRKLAAYVILGVNTEGKKEVLTITIGDNESAKYWLSVLNELKNRGVKDILIICADGLTGIKEAIATAFPKTEYQRCIVHQVRNTLKYVPDKDRKAFATDLKTIYQAADEQKALAALDRVTEKWTPKYPNSMKRWKDNWDAVSPIFKFSTTVRKVIYTTNAIEITEFHLSEAQLAEKCISKRYRPVKSPVSGHFRDYEKMDCYDPKLDTGLRRTEHYVRRTFT